MTFRPMTGEYPVWYGALTESARKHAAALERGVQARRWARGNGHVLGGLAPMRCDLVCATAVVWAFRPEAR
jgi:hypothetical protein